MHASSAGALSLSRKEQGGVVATEAIAKLSVFTASPSQRRLDFSLHVAVSGGAKERWVMGSSLERTGLPWGEGELLLGVC